MYPIHALLQRPMGSSMYCSKEELARRLIEHDIHVLECTPQTAALDAAQRKVDPSRVVARFSRCGPIKGYGAIAIRNRSQLLSSLSYLIQNVWFDQSLPWPTNIAIALKYSFCMDRIAAIRQEITMSGEVDSTILWMYINMAEFYAQAGYECMMYQLPINTYDEKLHMQSLSSALESAFSIPITNTKSRSDASCAGVALLFIQLCEAVQILCLRLFDDAPLGRSGCVFPLKTAMLVRSLSAGALPAPFRLFVSRMLSALAQGNPASALRVCEHWRESSRQWENSVEKAICFVIMRLYHTHMRPLLQCWRYALIVQSAPKKVSNVWSISELCAALHCSSSAVSLFQTISSATHATPPTEDTVNLLGCEIPFRSAFTTTRQELLTADRHLNEISIVNAQDALGPPAAT